MYLLGYNVIEKVLHSIDGREFPHLRHLQIKSDYEITYDDDSDSPLHEAATDKLFQSLFNKKVCYQIVLFTFSLNYLFQCSSTINIQKREGRNT